MTDFRPDGYSLLCPALAVDGAAAAIDFYVTVFGAEERMRMDGPDGSIAHAELQLGEVVLMLSDPFAELEWAAPHGSSHSAALNLYVPDCDATVAMAQEHGATVLQEPADQFYGDRSATLVDPFGHRWSVMTHIEDVPPEEMARRMEAMGGE